MGARLREYGGWLRPAFYGPDEARAVQSEALIARKTVGLYDASPLGKIEVIGPNAAALLDFCGYVPMSSLKPGRARYGFMLAESGIVHDDGVVLRLDTDRFVVSASSSHVASVRMILEEARQDRFASKDVFVHDITCNWCTLTASGPAARALLVQAGVLAPGSAAHDLPHMGVIESQWQGAPLRLARVSFTGDCAFEISVPLRHASALYTALDAARTTLGGAWIGLEAVMILRAEKGYILVGKDTDGVTMPHDLGWSGPRSKRQDPYFGDRALFTAEAQRPDRRQLVGLVTPQHTPLPTGAHIVPNSGDLHSLGFVTSSYYSPFLGRPIALAMVNGGRDLMGETVGVFHLGERMQAQICAPCALDPKGERLNG
jgi:sarcosine oxidase subunit alpha